MEYSGYVALTRQTGLVREMQVVATNIANLATTGYRREGVIFSEFIVAAGAGGSSVSMAHSGARQTDLAPAALKQTGGPFDLAIEGKGFFVIETALGLRLTRAGSFTPNDAGELVTPSGDRLLDEGGAPIFVPPDAESFRVAGDGTVSAGDLLLGRIVPVLPADPTDLVREAGVLFRSAGETQPVEDARVLQGYLEAANVVPVKEIARMIEVQRAYEMGQRSLEAEDERIRNLIRTLSRQ